MYGTQLVVIPVIIPINTAVTPTIDLSGYNLVGMEMPAAWTAAVMTFRAAASAPAAVADMYDTNGAEYTMTVAAGQFVPINMLDFVGAQFLVIRSGTGGTPVNQAAARTINLICRDM